MTSDDELPPIPDEVTELLEAERAIPPVDEGVRSSVWRGVGSAIGSGTDPGGGEGASGGEGAGTPAGNAAGAAGSVAHGASWAGQAMVAAVAFVAGGIAGASVYAMLDDASSSPQGTDTAGASVDDADRAERKRSGAESPESRAEVATTAGDAGSGQAMSGSKDVRGSRTRSGADRSAGQDLGPRRPSDPDKQRRSADTVRSTLAHEQRLIEAARAALKHGHARETLRHVERHARRFARGQLADQRELLAVRALVALDRHAEARARAVRFRERDSSSFVTAAMQQALRGARSSEGRTADEAPSADGGRRHPH